MYHEFKKYGSNQIEQLGTDLDPATFEFITPRVALDDKRTTALLDKISEVYGKYTGIQLSNLTHEPNSAWSQVRAKPENKGMRAVGIPNDLIREEFDQKKVK